MKVKVRENARELYLDNCTGYANWPYMGQLSHVEGKWVEVCEDRIAPDYFVTKPIPAVTLGMFLPKFMVEEVKGERGVAGYCHNCYRNTDPDKECCEYCGSEGESLEILVLRD